MNTHAENVQENQSKAIANSIGKKTSSRQSTFQFVDNRPKAIAQRKLQEIANNSSREKQLRSYQEIANNSPQANKTAQLQAIANTEVVQCYPPKGFKVHDHFEDRMDDHSISEKTVDDIVNNGTTYSDSSRPGVTIYYKGGIAVIYDGSQLKTCYPGKVKSRWDPK